MSHPTDHRLIAVDGPIGAGKTTLVTMLAEDLGGRAILEPAYDNPFLEEFYRDKKRNAFKTQIFFLLSRYQQQLELAQQELFHGTTVCDYTFAKDRIFADINLTHDEKALYDSIFNALHPRLPRPDLVIYVQATPQVLLKRIKQRGHGCEKEISGDYLEQLTEAYNQFFFSYTDSPLLVINSSHLDIVNKPDDWADLKKTILNHKQGIAHYHYAAK